MTKHVITRWPKAGMKTFKEYHNDNLVRYEKYDKNGILLYVETAKGWTKTRPVYRKDGTKRVYTTRSDGYKSIVAYDANDYMIYFESHLNGMHDFTLKIRDKQGRIIYDERGSGHWVKTYYDDVNDATHKIEGKFKQRKLFDTRRLKIKINKDEFSSKSREKNYETDTLYNP